MRFRKGRSFPHPVLGNNDDVVGSFSPELTRSNDRELMSLEFKDLRTGNGSIDAMITGGAACVAILMDCAATELRELFVTHDEGLLVEIPLANVRKQMEVICLVLALEEIEEYKPENLHEDYGDAAFRLDKGDILAISHDWRIDLGSDWDPLRAPIPAIMRIRRGDFDSGPFEIRMDDDKIIVEVSRTDFESYNRRKTDCPALIHSSIVLPVLTHAIAEHEKTDFKEYPWAQRLQQLLEQNPNIGTGGDPLDAAQKLLELPVERGFAALDRVLTMEDNVE
jgi:hypothetical protein